MSPEMRELNNCVQAAHNKQLTIRHQSRNKL